MAWTTDSTKFIVAILHGIGAPVTRANMLALRAWQQAEGGPDNYNPFNTTMSGYGGVSTNSVGVKSYPSYAAGLAATLATLRSGYYGAIRSALHAGTNPYAVAAAVGASPWGTSGSLMAEVLKGYGGNYTPVAGSTPMQTGSGSAPHSQPMAPVGAPPNVGARLMAQQLAMQGRMAAELALSQVHPVQINLPALNLPTAQGQLGKALQLPDSQGPSLAGAMHTPTISTSPFKAQTDQGASQLAALRRGLGG